MQFDSYCERNYSKLLLQDIFDAVLLTSVYDNWVNMVRY